LIRSEFCTVGLTAGKPEFYPTVRQFKLA
jgi:hypothetical protein